MWFWNFPFCDFRNVTNTDMFSYTVWDFFFLLLQPWGRLRSLLYTHNNSHQVWRHCCYGDYLAYPDLLFLCHVVLHTSRLVRGKMLGPNPPCHCGSPATTLRRKGKRGEGKIRGGERKIELWSLGDQLDFSPSPLFSTTMSKLPSLKQTCLGSSVE